MPRRITIVQGHPDSDSARFGSALADAYAKGAETAGHEVRRVRVAELDFPVLRSRQEWHRGPAAPAIRESQDAIAWSDHLVILFPIWFGTLPALLKAWFEQVLRPGFAVGKAEAGKQPGPKLLCGRSARLVVSMGMPALVYRLFFSQGLKLVRRNLLGFAGISPVRSTLIGTVEAEDPRLGRWIEKLEALGRSAL